MYIVDINNNLRIKLTINPDFYLLYDVAVNEDPECNSLKTVCISLPV